jgi:hypothetical protein
MQVNSVQYNNPSSQTIDLMTHSEKAAHTRTHTHAHTHTHTQRMLFNEMWTDGNTHDTYDGGNAPTYQLLNCRINARDLKTVYNKYLSHEKIP